ncbi:MAG: SGNH/GDSL hydrolase family protein, partial [Gemmatimonadales bacterium]|nr:SGNH/GDSL hydrolase family protein [Gemmatimonadales bacterium]
MTLRTLAASLLLALPLIAGCRNDETLAAPDVSTSGGLMARYVAMGNSITAGYQSGGINDSTQRRSYAAVFARQAGAPYFYASLRMPGCTAPFTLNPTQARVGGAAATGCALRAPDQNPFLSNVAVPGARAVSALTN